MGRIVTFELDISKPITEQQMKELEEAEKLPFVYDEDCPPLTTEQLRHMKRARDIRKDKLLTTV